MYVVQSYEKNVEPQPVYFKKVVSETVFRFCEDILNALRGYPQQPARISSTAREDILVFTACYGFWHVAHSFLCLYNKKRWGNALSFHREIVTLHIVNI